MTREFVLVQVEGGDRFRAEVDVNADKLDPGNMPLRLAGVFIKHPHWPWVFAYRLVSRQPPPIPLRNVFRHGARFHG